MEQHAVAGGRETDLFHSAARRSTRYRGGKRNERLQRLQGPDRRLRQPAGLVGALVPGFIRQSEQKLNAELRVDRMIKTSQNLVNCRCAPLPDDWLQMDLVKIPNANAADGLLPIRYKAATSSSTSATTGPMATIRSRAGSSPSGARPMRSMASPT